MAAMKDSTERRFQRRISRLQQQVTDLKGSRDHWRDQAVRLAKQIKPNGSASELMELAGYR